MDSETRELLRMAGRAYMAESDGVFCGCAEPRYCGRSSRICFACGLVNEQRIKDIDAAMNGPHYFEALFDDESHCNLCFGHVVDPRHATLERKSL